MIGGTITATPIGDANMESLAAALRAEDLPTDDLQEGGKRFFCFQGSGRDIGYAGLELCGPDALLRSIVTSPDARGAGHGRDIVSWLAAYAATRGVRRLYLLTKTAEGFFTKQGFTPVPREAAPDAIRKTREFASLCPATAVLMSREVGP